MYDSPWKEAIETYFPAFMAFFFPEPYEEIDWDEGYTFFDKELQPIEPDTEIGTRTVDNLVQVQLYGGIETLILVHIEVQAQPDVDFEKRMFVYHYLIFNKYDQPLVSLAILADQRSSWRPDNYGYGRWGCRLQFDFPTVKLLDIGKNWNELSRSTNPFAVVVQAHLKAQATKHNPDARLKWKLAVVRRLYEIGLGRRDIQNLFRIIDWLMDLPDGLSDIFWSEHTKMEREKNMPFVTTGERIGIRKGRLLTASEYVLDTLEIRFGSVPDKTKESILKIKDPDVLGTLHRQAIEAESLEAFWNALNSNR